MANFSMVYARSALCDARFGQKAYGLRGFGRIGCVNQGVFGQKIGIGAKAAKRRGGCRERAGDGVAGAMTAGGGHEGDAAAGRGGEPAGLRSGGGEPAGLRSGGSEPAGRRSGGGECARGDGHGGVRNAAIVRERRAREAANVRGRRVRTTIARGCQARRCDELGRMLYRAQAPELAALRVRLSTLQRPAPSAPPSPPSSRTATWLALPRSAPLRSRSHDRAPLHVPPKLLGVALLGLAYPAASASAPARAPHHARVRPTAPALSAPPDRSALDGSGSPAWRRCA